jgi:hypothetical protein
MKKLLTLRKERNQPAPIQSNLPSTPVTAPKSKSKLSSEDLWRIRVKEVHDNARGKPLVNDLQVITERYLIESHGPDEVKLLTLINQHDAKRSAFLSCAYFLRTENVRSLLLQFRDERYFDLILQVRSVNINAVGNLEARCAENLKSVLSSPHLTHIQQLALIEQALCIDIPDDLQLKTLGRQHGRTVSRKFRDYLNNVRQDLSWPTCKLYEDSCSWLASLPDTSPVRELLEETGRTWTAWAVWKPNRKRLESWSKIALVTRQKLRVIIALEGPDFNTYRHMTMKESLMEPVHFANSELAALIHHESSCSREEISNIMQELLFILDTLVSQESTSLLLFEKFLFQKIDVDTIASLGAICRSGKSSILVSMLKILGPQKNATQLSGVLQLLPLLRADSERFLRESLSGTLAKIVEQGLERMKTRLCKEIDQGIRPNETANRICSIASKLRRFDWLCTIIAPDTRIYLDNLPSEETLKVFLDLREKSESLSANNEDESPLLRFIDSFIKTQLGGSSDSSREESTVVIALVDIWQKPVKRPYRDLALQMAMQKDMPPEIRSACLSKLLSTDETVVIEMKKAMGYELDNTCVQFIRVLIGFELSTTDDGSCWHRLVHWMVTTRGYNLGSSIKSARDWLEMMENVQKLSGQWRGQLHCEIDGSLLRWAQSLKLYFSELKELEGRLSVGAGMHWIFSNPSDRVLEYLPLLGKNQPDTTKTLAQALLRSLRSDGTNVEDFFKDYLYWLKVSSAKSQQICARVVKLFDQTSSIGLASVWLKAWFDIHRDREDKDLMRRLATSLSLDLSLDASALRTRLRVTQDHIENQIEKLVEEVEGLDRTRIALQIGDARATSDLISRLGIQVPRGRHTGQIPHDLLDVIEQTGENEFELFFPLTDLKPLQRLAAGVGDTQALIVRLIVETQSIGGSFCLHLHPGVNDELTSMEAHEHSRIGKFALTTKGSRRTFFKQFASIKSTSDDGQDDIDEEDNTAHFQGCNEPPKRLIFQLGQMIHTEFAGDHIVVEDVYRSLSTRISSLAQFCVICGSSLAGSGRWRSTTCSAKCSRAWRRAPLELRLMDIVDDPDAVDALLTVAFSAVSTGGMLLPGCPLDAANLLTTFTAIPSLATLQSSENIGTAVRALGGNVEQMLCWLLHEFRGYLASPPEQFKIPNMPGIHQFVLADYSPDLHAAFTQSGQRGKVTFHGTSLDRVYQILCQGLQNLSQTALQRNGAAGGSGIYLAEEPATSFTYSTQSYGGWAQSQFQSVRAMFGCEMIGPTATLTQSIHVVPNANDVAIRYLFIFPMTAAAPLRRNIEPAMSSAYASLWSGVG